MEWPSCLDEYQKLVNRMNTPRVVIDNGVCSKATLVKVDSARKHGILLEAVQVLTDLDLSINKAYISSDGRWFMDVFHVTDSQGRKLTDERLIASIEQSLSAGVGYSCHCHPSASDLDVLDGLTALELTGSDRPGLLSEVFAVLSDLSCSVVDAKVWTHSGRIASLIFVRDDESGSPVEDSRKIHLIEARLRNLLKGDDDVRGATTTVSSTSIAHADRRLHQMMFADRDYERVSSGDACSPSRRPAVSVQNWVERGYSVVSVRCPDRPKLLFDVVCTLTDMKYVVFHGTVDTSVDRAHLELYIRHTDGSPISSDAERQRVIQCLEAAIERRASEGVKLELCALDRRGLLAEVTRTFRENGLSVTRAEVSTKDGAAANVFYLTDAAGHAADPKAIAAVIERVGPQYLKVAEQQRAAQKRPANDKAEAAGGGVKLFSLGSLVMRNLLLVWVVEAWNHSKDLSFAIQST